MRRTGYCEATPDLGGVSGYVHGLGAGVASRDSFVGRRAGEGYEGSGQGLRGHSHSVNGVLMAFLRGVRS